MEQSAVRTCALQCANMQDVLRDAPMFASSCVYQNSVQIATVNVWERNHVKSAAMEHTGRRLMLSSRTDI